MDPKRSHQHQLAACRHSLQLFYPIASMQHFNIRSMPSVGLLSFAVLAFASIAVAAPLFSVRNDAPKTWALLVAGSDTYSNYRYSPRFPLHFAYCFSFDIGRRHQADVSHSYHVLVSRGIPPSQIIVMMYDDIVRALPPWPSRARRASS